MHSQVRAPKIAEAHLRTMEALETVLPEKRADKILNLLIGGQRNHHLFLTSAVAEKSTINCRVPWRLLPVIHKPYLYTLRCVHLASTTSRVSSIFTLYSTGGVP